MGVLPYPHGANSTSGTSNEYDTPTPMGLYYSLTVSIYPSIHLSIYHRDVFTSHIEDERRPCIMPEHKTKEFIFQFRNQVWGY
jgi:hypothetical protein